MTTLETGRNPRSAFTLVEIVITLTILALLAGISVPSFRGLLRERQAQEPLAQLAELARLSRERALRLQRPYVIAFDDAGCFAAPHLPLFQGNETYLARKSTQDQYRLGREIEAASDRRFGVPSGDSATFDDRDFLIRYDWPEGYQVKLRLWGDFAWEEVGSGQVRNWVIQPNGLNRPLQIRLENQGILLEATFQALTAEIETLRSIVP
ncbi:MAG: prepilin-type N-terminal cleavage/methylation domain-containing protein [Verrucomicrobiota bacterium]